MSEGDNPSDFAQSVQSTAVQPPTAGLYCFNREEANARLDSKAIRNSLMRWSSFSSSFSSTFLGFFWWWEKWHRKTHEIPTNVKEWFQRKHWKPFKHMMSDWFIAKLIDVHCTHKSGANGGEKTMEKTSEKTHCFLRELRWWYWNLERSKLGTFNILQPRFIPGMRPNSPFGADGGSDCIACNQQVIASSTWKKMPKFWGTAPQDILYKSISR